MIIKFAIKDAEVKTMLKNLQDKMETLTPVMIRVGRIIKGSVIKNFMEGGRPRKWKPSKRALRESGQTLLDTGRLRDSIKARAFTNRAEVGTKVIYSAIHQFGGKAGRDRKATIPIRPYLMVHDEDWTEIKSVLTDCLLQGTK